MTLDINSINEKVSPYAKQKEQGYKSLHFSYGLEDEFKDFYINLNIWRIRGSQFAAIPIYIIYGIIDLITWHEYAAFWSVIIRFIIVCPIWLGILFLTYKESFRNKLYPIIETGLVIVSIGTVVLSTIALSCGNDLRFSGLIIMQSFVFLFTGILFRRAVFLSLFFSVPLFIGEFIVGVELSIMLYHAFALIVANIFGMLSCYFFEYSSRTNFLNTKLLNDFAERDGLTGLYNRRMFETHLQRVWKQAQRDDVTIAVAMIDVDYFKAYNDYYGHQKGDSSLCQVADTIASVENRPLDMSARYGGEEFVVIWYGIELKDVHVLGNKMLESIRKLDIRHAMSCIDRKITASIGVSIVNPNKDGISEVEKIVKIADKALYEAKNKGRDRIIIRSSEKKY